jgi:hypothetical protein
MALEVADIARVFGVSDEVAARVDAVRRGVTKPEDEPERYPDTCAWIRKCHHRPADPDIKLRAIAEDLQASGVGYGVEGHCNDVGTVGFSYVNMGDTYDGTLILLFDHGRFAWKLGAWGDLSEKYLGSSEGGE